MSHAGVIGEGLVLESQNRGENIHYKLYMATRDHESYVGC